MAALSAQLQMLVVAVGHLHFAARQHQLNVVAPIFCRECSKKRLFCAICPTMLRNHTRERVWRYAQHAIVISDVISYLAQSASVESGAAGGTGCPTRIWNYIRQEATFMSKLRRS